MPYGSGHDTSKLGEGKRYRAPNKVRVKQDHLSGYYQVEHKHPEYGGGDYQHYSSHGTKEEANGAKAKLQQWFKDHPRPEEE